MLKIGDSQHLLCALPKTLQNKTRLDARKIKREGGLQSTLNADSADLADTR